MLRRNGSTSNIDTLILDKQLRKKRTVHEARILARCPHGVLAPAVYFVDDITQTIYMEYVDGKTAKEVWDELDRGDIDVSKSEKKQNIAHKIGNDSGKDSQP